MIAFRKVRRACPQPTFAATFTLHNDHDANQNPDTISTNQPFAQSISTANSSPIAFASMVAGRASDMSDMRGKLALEFPSIHFNFAYSTQFVFATLPFRNSEKSRVRRMVVEQRCAIPTPRTPLKSSTGVPSTTNCTSCASLIFPNSTHMRKRVLTTQCSERISGQHAPYDLLYMYSIAAGRPLSFALLTL